MAPRQYYTTTVIDPEARVDATFLVVPRAAFADERLLDRPRELAEILEARRTFSLDEALDVVPALAVALEGDIRSVEALDQIDGDGWLEMLSKVRPSARRGFTSYCATAEIIPFEQSPPAGNSLLSIVGKGTAIGTGATLGFIVSGPTLLAFVTVPLGMIIFGAASGVAKGLEGGLDHKLKSLLGMHDPDNGPASQR